MLFNQFTEGRFSAIAASFNTPFKMFDGMILTVGCALLVFALL